MQVYDQNQWFRGLELIEVFLTLYGLCTNPLGKYYPLKLPVGDASVGKRREKTGEKFSKVSKRDTSSAAWNVVAAISGCSFGSPNANIVIFISVFSAIEMWFLYYCGIPLLFSTEDKIPCESPSSIPNVVLLQAEQRQYSHGDEVTCGCTPGSDNTEEMKIKCLNGEWKPLPVCAGNLFP